MVSDSMIAMEWLMANKYDASSLKHWRVEEDSLKFEYNGEEQSIDMAEIRKWWEGAQWSL